MDNQYWDQILQHLKDYYVNREVYFVFAIVCFLYLLLFEKRIRKLFILPLLFIAIVILNPYLYEKVFSKTYMYWRFFWLFSEHLLIGTVFICLVDRFKSDLLKIFCFLILCSLIIINGNNVYNTNLFYETVSLEKLPPGVIEICDTMLELEEEPYVIPDVHFSCSDRQYSGKIKQLYGRNAFGYISDISGEALEIRNYSYVDGDFWQVCYYASKNGYQFIVTENRYIMPDTLKDRGFEFIKEVVTDDNTFYLYYYVGRDKTLAEETD